MDADGQHLISDVIKIYESAIDYPGSLNIGSREIWIWNEYATKVL